MKCKQQLTSCCQPVSSVRRLFGHSHSLKARDEASFQFCLVSLLCILICKQCLGQHTH